MADTQKCRRQAAECSRLSQADVTPASEAIMRVALANQMDRLNEHDPINAAHLALAR
jgi:hypothetical protein